MYAIYAYIDPSNHPNVGIYGIHGASGNRIENIMIVGSCWIISHSFSDLLYYLYCHLEQGRLARTTH